MSSLQPRSKTRTLAVLSWAEKMSECYTRLSAADREDLDNWENSGAFTSTDEWPGWAREIGPRPGTKISRPDLFLLRRA